MAKYKIVTFGCTVYRNGQDVEEEVITRGGYDDFEIVHVPGEDDQKETFLKEAEDADGLVVWTFLGKEEYERMPKLKVVASPGIGVDRFDLDDATEAGVIIGNCPDYCVEDVAVHTVSMLMDCTRRLTALDRKMRQGIWKVQACGKMYRMTNKVYGLVSFGHIPQRITELMKPFGVKFMAFDPFVPDEVFEKWGVEKAESLNELFEKADYISVHTPHMDATHHMIGKEQFDRMKPNSILVLTGRGGVVDEEALRDSILAGKPVAVGLDVIEDELTYKSCLQDLDEVVQTPHSAYYSEEAVEDLRRKTIEQCVEVIRDKKIPVHTMNKNVIGHTRMEKGL